MRDAWMTLSGFVRPVFVKTLVVKLFQLDLVDTSCWAIEKFPRKGKTY